MSLHAADDGRERSARQLVHPHLVDEARGTVEGAAIVETVVGLAQAFGLATVTEGVERADQLGVLARLGCLQAQGFHWKRPAPAEEMAAWMLAAAAGASRPVNRS